MPYIKKQDRIKWNKLSDPLIRELLDVPPEEIDGTLNYIITRILKKVTPIGYYHYNRTIGLLECIKQEFYRRVIAPYENMKIVENGDV